MKKNDRATNGKPQQNIKTRRKKTIKALKGDFFNMQHSGGGGQFGHILVASIAIKRSFKNCVWDPFFFHAPCIKIQVWGGGPI